MMPDARPPARLDITILKDGFFRKPIQKHKDTILKVWILWLSLSVHLSIERAIHPYTTSWISTKFAVYLPCLLVITHDHVDFDPHPPAHTHTEWLVWGIR